MPEVIPKPVTSTSDARHQELEEANKTFSPTNEKCMFHSMEELIQQNDSHVELYTGLPEQNFPVQVSSMGSCRVE